MSKPSWDLACEHAAVAVLPDNAARRFFCDGVGLLVAATQGSPVLVEATHLVFASGELQPVHELSPEHSELANGLRAKAEQCWRQQGHPGWSVFEGESLKKEAAVQAGPVVQKKAERRSVRSPVPRKRMYDEL